MNKTGKIVIFITLFLACLILVLAMWAIFKPNYKINVYEADTHDLVQVIEDQQLIRELISRLNSAERISTVMMDMNLPEYYIEIMENQKVIYRIGYYVDENRKMGQYYHYTGEYLYQVNLKLPILHRRYE